jgi:hypothetical protein
MALFKYGFIMNTKIKTILDGALSLSIITVWASILVYAMTIIWELAPRIFDTFKKMYLP